MKFATPSCPPPITFTNHAHANRSIHTSHRTSISVNFFFFSPFCKLISKLFSSFTSCPKCIAVQCNKKCVYNRFIFFVTSDMNVRLPEDIWHPFISWSCSAWFLRVLKLHPEKSSTDILSRLLVSSRLKLSSLFLFLSLHLGLSILFPCSLPLHYTSFRPGYGLTLPKSQLRAQKNYFILEDLDSFPFVLVPLQSQMSL